MMAVTDPRPSTTTSIVLSDQWRRYIRTRDPRARDHLILAYSPIVKYAAGRIASRMPSHVELADLVSYGLGGLIDAVERFDPARGIAFETYAALRIRGAIFDGLRSMDWVPRKVRDEGRELERVVAKLTTLLQRVPRTAEIAAELSLDPLELDAVLRRVADARVVALDETRSSGSDGVGTSTLLDTLCDLDAVDPAASADAADLRERIAAAIDDLPSRERLVLGLRYTGELSYAEIGRVLGVGESRVCQLHASAARGVRALLTEDAVPIAA